MSSNRRSLSSSNSQQKRKQSSSLKRPANKSNRDLKPSTGQPSLESQQPTINIISNDPATKNISKLRQVTFLQKDTSQPDHVNQSIDARGLEQRTGQMAQEYLKRRQNMTDQVQRLLNQNKVAQMEIMKRNQKEEEEAARRRAEAIGGSSSLVQNLMGSIESEETKKDQKLADGFIRSKRNLAMRARDQVDGTLQTLEHEKEQLVERLNENLLKLDQLQVNKRELSGKLAEQMQFVRDLQKATGGAGLEDLNTIVSDQIKNEYHREQELNTHLQDQLTRADQERQELLERLKLLTGEKEIVVVAQNGTRKTYRVTSVNIERLLNDIRDMKDEIQQQERAIERVHVVRHQIEDELYAQESQIHALQYERDHLLCKVQQMGDKHSEAVCSLEGEKRRLDLMHTKHIKLLATRLFEEALKKSVRRNLELAFEQVERSTNVEKHQFGAVWKFRNVILLQERRRVKKALHHWYQYACNPLKSKEINTRIPLFFHRQERLAHFYNCWRKVYENRTYGKLTKEKALLRVFRQTEKTMNRQVQRAMVRWRKRMIELNEGAKAMNKIITGARVQRVHDAFRKWQSHVADQNFRARMQSLCVQLACKQMAQKVIVAWRMQAAASKLMKRNMKMRAIKNLKVYCLAQGHTKGFSKGVERFADQANKLLLQGCFDALRLCKERRKLERDYGIIVNNLDPKMEEWRERIADVRRRMTLAQQRRAMQMLVIQPLSRQLGMYLQQWKMATAYRAHKYSKDTKMLMIATYKAKLRVALDRWRQCRDYKVIAIQQDQVMGLQTGNLDLEIQNRQAGQQIAQADQHAKHLGSKHLRKLLISSFEQNLRYWVKKWKECADDHGDKQHAAGRILRKIRNHYLRMAFTKYKRGSDMVGQDKLNARRVTEVQARLQFRTKRRIYSAIKVFGDQHHEATVNLGYLIRRLDHHVKHRSFLNWQQFARKELESSLFQQETDIVRDLKSTQDVIGKKCDNLNDKRIETKRLRKLLTTEANKTLSKWVMRFHNGGAHYGFTTWRQKTQKLKHRDQVLINTRRHMVNGYMRAAMFRWKESIRIEQNFNLIDYTEEETKQAGYAQDKINYIRKQAEKSRVKVRAAHAQLDKEINYTSKKLGNTVNTLIVRKDLNYVQFRQRYILQQWYRFTAHRKKCCRVLENAISKILLQRTFTEIRQNHLAEVREEQETKKSNKICRLSRKFNCRWSFDHWKKVLIKDTNKTIRYVQDETEVQIKRHNDFVERTKQHHTKVLDKHCKKNVKLDCFTEWRKWAYSKRVVKSDAKNLDDKIKAYWAKRAVSKWAQRKETTQKARALYARLRERRYSIYTKAVFGELKRRYEIARYFTKLTVNLMAGIRVARLEEGLKRIKARADVNQEKANRDKLHATKQLASLMSLHVTKSTVCGLSALRNYSKEEIRSQEVRKSILRVMKNRDARQAFHKWRMNARLMTTADYFNNGEGPVNLECWRLRWDIQNLIRMAQADAATDDEILAVLDSSRQRYKHLMEKSVCRLLVNGDKDLKLMPWAFDQLKQNMQERKWWRMAILFVNRKAQKLEATNSLQHAFEKWRHVIGERRRELYGTPMEELKERTMRNVKTLNQMAEKLDVDVDNMQEFTDQRNMLFRGYISGQKLAISASINSHQRAQQKAIMRLSDHGNLNLQARISDALKANLDKIGQLKDVIAKQESRNEHLAVSNDSFRHGAMDAVSLARQVEELQRDRERLSVDLADKTATIKKLLEDNQFLHDRIGAARVDAKINLEKTTRMQERKREELESLRLAERENISVVRNSAHSLAGPARDSVSGQPHNHSPLRTKSGERAAH